MKGLSNDTSQALFKEAEIKLTEQGYIPVNPWHISHLSNKWEEKIIHDLNILKTCDGIYMLNNWKDSYGATVEYYFAKGSGLKIMGEI